MTRTFTAYQALAAGAKTTRELAAALRCSFNQARKTVALLIEAGQVRRRARPGCRGYAYEVAR